MLEKWSYYQFIKNWKKNFTGFFVTLFIVAQCIAQTSPEYGLEINANKGLPNNIVRKTFIDNEGSVWVGTDGGISVFPKHNKTKLRICSLLGRVEVWDIYQSKNYLYIGTYNDGVSIFDIITGNLIRKFNTEQIPRFRKFKLVQNHLFVIAGKGLKEFKDLKLIRWLDSHPQPKQSKYFSIDVFEWKQKIYLSFFPYNPLLVMENGEFMLDKGILGQFLTKNPSKFIMLAQEFDNKLVCANSQNGYYTFDENSTIEEYTFHQNRATSFIIWDMKVSMGKLFMAVGNTENFDQGFIYTYKQQKEPTIQLEKDQVQHFIWSLTVDPWNRGIWASVVNFGAYFYPNYAESLELPFKADHFFCGDKYWFVWNGQFIAIQNKIDGHWKIQQNQWAIRKVLQHNKFFIAHCDEGVFLIDKATGKITQISHITYLNVFIQNGYLHLVQYFGIIESYQFSSRKIVKRINASINTITNVASNKDLAVLFGENLGYAVLTNDTAWKLKLPQNISLWHHDYYLVGKLLVIKDGELLHCISLDIHNRKIANYFTVDLKSTFYLLNMQWIQSSDNGLWIGNSLIALQIKIDEINRQIDILKQFYLGNDIFTSQILIFENSIQILRTRYIQTININQPHPNFSIDLDYPTRDISGYHFPLFPENQNFKMELISEDYLTDYYSIFEYDLASYKERIHHRYLMSTNVFWTNDLKESSYQARFKLNNWTKSIPIRIERYVYQRIEFGIFMLITLIILAYYIYSIQTDQFRMRQKILQMELSTLKSNFNPHFIFNTMNLIQSLIVQGDKKRALKASSELAHLNRLFLETSELEYINIAKEIELARKYIDLERLRFEHDRVFEFELKIENDLNLYDWIIPPLILQPLLENALKHGALIVPDDAKIGIRIQRISPNELHLNIYNSFIPDLEQNKNGMGIGRQLVENRIKLFNERFVKRWAIEFGSSTDSVNYHCHIIITKLLLV